MKKRIALLAMITCLFSCKKNVVSPNATDFLAGTDHKTWKIVKLQEVYTNKAISPITDLTPDTLKKLIAADKRDDLIIFYKDSTEKVNQNAAGIQPYSNYYSGRWFLTSNNKRFNGFIPMSGVLTAGWTEGADILELTASKLVLEYYHKVSATLYYYDRLTFEPQ